MVAGLDAGDGLRARISAPGRAGREGRTAASTGGNGETDLWSNLSRSAREPANARMWSPFRPTRSSLFPARKRDRKPSAGLPGAPIRSAPRKKGAYDIFDVSWPFGCAVCRRAVSSLFRLTTNERGRGMRRTIADEKPGFPCRVSLTMPSLVSGCCSPISIICRRIRPIAPQARSLCA